MKFTRRDGAVRWYDGTGTAQYISLDFDRGDLSFPMGQPTPDEILYLHRDKMDANAHYVRGSDETMMAPVPCTLSIDLTDSSNTTNVLNWLIGCNDGGTTKVNLNTVATTQGDTQRDGATANPTFADSNKLTFNIEMLWTSSGTDIHFALNEVFVDMSKVTLAEAEDGVTLSFTGDIYGTIVYQSAGEFAAGDDIEAEA